MKTLFTLILFSLFSVYSFGDELQKLHFATDSKLGGDVDISVDTIRITPKAGTNGQSYYYKLVYL